VSAPRPRTGILPVTVEPPTPTAAPSALKGETSVREPGRAGRALARRAAEARATVPDLELAMIVDAQAILALQRESGCGRTAILARACATALREHPGANAAYRDGRFELYSRVNLGIAVATDEGQLTPAVLDADTKSLEQLNDEIDALTRRARDGALTPPELAGTTFTLADLGDHAAHRWSLPIAPPHAAGLSAGAIRRVPVIRDGAIVPGEELELTLACDHRILFGSRAAAFLARIADLLVGARQ